MFEQNPDVGQHFVLCHQSASRSGFRSNIDDFLELHRKNKNENRKSGSSKCLGIPKAIQNRSKHSQKVPELDAPLA